MKTLVLALCLPMIALADVAPRSTKIDPSRFVELSAFTPAGLPWFLSPTGRTVVLDTNDVVTFYDMVTKKETEKLQGHDAGFHDGGWSMNGRVFATAGEDEVVKVWDITDGTPKDLLTVKPHAGYSCSVAVSPDGKLMATGGARDGTAKIIEIATGKELRSASVGTGGVYAINFDAKGRHVVTSGQDNALRAVNVETGEVKVIEDRIGYIHQYEFSRDGRFLAGGVRGSIVIWDARTWKQVQKIEENTGHVNYVALSPDGCWVAGTCADGKLRIWDTKTGKLAIELGDGTIQGRVTFTPENRVVAVGVDRSIHVFGKK